MAVSKVKGGTTVKSNVSKMRTALRDNIEGALRGAAFDGRSMAVREINKTSGQANPHRGTRTITSPGLRGWTSGLNRDTGALASSIYVFGPRFNDYDKCLSRARALYLTRYKSEHFDQRQLPKIEAPRQLAGAGVSSAQAGFATCLKYGLWWEKGHDNRWTRRHEQQAFMGPSRDYALERLAIRLRGKNLLESRDRSGSGRADKKK